MRLEAIVAESTFNELLDDLDGLKIQAIRRRYDNLSENTELHILAEASPARMLEIAKQVSASIGKNEYDIEQDRILINARSSVGQWCWDGCQGSLSIWSTEFKGGF